MRSGNPAPPTGGGESDEAILKQAALDLFVRMDAEHRRSGKRKPIQIIAEEIPLVAFALGALVFRVSKAEEAPADKPAPSTLQDILDPKFVALLDRIALKIEQSTGKVMNRMMTLERLIEVQAARIGEGGA